MQISAADKASQPPGRDIYSVSRLNQEARQMLEQGFPRIWLEGELSNLARPSSGHLYFTLKDNRAQIRGAMFRNRNALLRFKPEEGLQVLVRARISLYEPRGDYQLIAEHMEAAGDGVLQRAFEALKEKLSKEGLFDSDRKRPLPALPERIGVITSPSGAAIRDVLTVLRRRFPAIPVLIYPVPVQGKDAGNQIAAMIQHAAARKDCDVLILTRGGGSLEDLWAFNEEVVARAIADCTLPTLSAVGHEVDITIADFVADGRAPTPSAAAELVSPEQSEWLARVNVLGTRARRQINRQTTETGQRIRWLQQRLQQRHPGQYLRQQAQRLDELEQRSRFIINKNISMLQSYSNELHANLQRLNPGHLIARRELQHRSLAQRLRAAIKTLMLDQRRQLAITCRALDTISPLATLDRGYAIVTRHPGNQILHKASSVTAGEQIEARLAEGRLLCSVDEIIQ